MKANINRKSNKKADDIDTSITTKDVLKELKGKGRNLYVN